MPATLRSTGLPSLAEARDAVAVARRRLVDLVRGGLDPSANAVGHWTVADVAAHLSHVYAFDSLSANGTSSLSEADLPDFVHDGSVLPSIEDVRDFEDVGRINDAVLRQDPERDLARLAQRIDRSLDELDRTFAAGPEDTTVTWLGGVRLPLVAIAGHVLFEANGHGTDLAGASGRRWKIDHADVRIIFDGFLAPYVEAAPTIIRGASGSADLQGCIDLRLRGQTRAYLVFGDGSLRIERDAPRRADLHVSADPATFLLLMAGRTGRLAAALRGGIVAWGRRPLHGMRLMDTLASP